MAALTVALFHLAALFATGQNPFCTDEPDQPHLLCVEQNHTMVKMLRRTGEGNVSILTSYRVIKNRGQIGPHGQIIYMVRIKLEQI